MQVICSSLGALAVALIYYAYRDYMQVQARREHNLHERVAYLLWAMAEEMR